jgi:hypothetical protein
MKESVHRAFSYVQSKKSDLGVARDLDTSDIHVEVIDLLATESRRKSALRSSSPATRPCGKHL